jgi:hypothetical protein
MKDYISTAIIDASPETVEIDSFSAALNRRAENTSLADDMHNRAE